jgi:hypothetical protein
MMRVWLRLLSRGGTGGRAPRPDDEMVRSERLRSSSWLRRGRERRPGQQSWLIARAVSLKAF